jgi:hypothetical protein
MRRAQAILVIVALLATPLALLARGTAAGSMDCNGMCCLPHGAHHHASQPPGHDTASCEHGLLVHVFQCTMRTGHHGPDYGLSSSITPAKASALVTIASLHALQLGSLQLPVENISAGFQQNPFQPPRS